MKVDFLATNTLKGSIDSVKLDFITHAYPLVQESIVFDTVRMASLADISAFKLNAIVGNGTRLKDFIDIAFLSSHLSLSKMLEAFELKYSLRNPVMAVKALTYRKEINFKEPLDFIERPISWNTISSRIHEMIQSPEIIFPVLS